MVNVYDLVANFYENDDGWNAVLRREYVEGFLRKEAWNGVADDELQGKWEYILMLCLYLGHAEIYLGDMNADDIVDAIAWCGRNVTDFEISYDSVKDFLSAMGGLFVYLKDKHAISSSLAPHLAKSQLLKDDGTLALINANGDFLPGEDERIEYAADDVPTKIFLNMGDALAELLEELHDYFQKENFNLDLERAVFFYHGFFSTDKIEAEPETEEFWQCFWDYFLFDYHLLVDDQTPLQHFLVHGKSKNLELVRELSKSRLAIFTVEEACDDGFYSCKDFLTDEEYSLNLPLELDSEIKDMLIVGHIFYNKTMVMNYVRCFQINPISRKRLRGLFADFYAWYKIQEPEGRLTVFIARHPMVIRRLTYFSAHYFAINGFNYKTNVKDYVPTKEDNGFDAVIDCIKKIMQPQHFSYRDISLASRLWKDFSKTKTLDLRKPEIWASGVVENYIRLNGVYKYSPKSIAEMCWNVPMQALSMATDNIKQKLRIEIYDPRYCNEEGFLMMMFSKKL
ncbi:MAG: hypothetical protein WC127_02065 [Acidaminococcaceae bacterium]